MPNTQTPQELLLEMLTYRRPAGSVTESEFILKYIDPLGAVTDDFGNRLLLVGDGSCDTIWSSHTDTVHRQEGRQQVAFDGVLASLPSGSDSNCLGADCTTGVWLMVEMAKHGVPGLYIFHRAEEVGGKGSRYIASETPHLLKGYKKAIAFDRYGHTSIITHQFGRCCSDEFTASLAKQLPDFKADSGGVFTDTANYLDLIPECTNLSVGYNRHHTPCETQDVPFALHLLSLMKNLDTSVLSVSRDPTDKDDDHIWWGNLGSTRTSSSRLALTPTLDSRCQERPEIAAEILAAFGVDVATFDEYAYELDCGYAQ